MADTFEVRPGDTQVIILIAADEPAERGVSAGAFTELGYWADSSATALLPTGSHPDIAPSFTDIVMPDINGCQLADAAPVIRPGLKVLYTTGYMRSAVVHTGVLDAGVERTAKPLI